MTSSEPATQVVSSSREVAASADRIFELIADPSQQPFWDGNDNLSHAVAGQRVHAVGEVFVMTLTRGSVRENHVVEFEEGRRIAWRPSEPGGTPPGHLWRWELDPIDAGHTRVTHTYDWSQLTDESRIPKAQATTPECLAASLDRLAELAGSHVPVTYDHCEHIEGPFFHGTKVTLEIGAELIPGYASNFQAGRVSNNIYFTARIDTAAWGAELATALAGSEGRGHIYVVEPLGPFEDDPNVTNKRFPGNPTESYRTRHPLRVVGTVDSWDGHSPDVLKGMLDNLTRMREQGLDLIED